MTNSIMPTERATRGHRAGIIMAKGFYRWMAPCALISIWTVILFYLIYGAAILVRTVLLGQTWTVDELETEALASGFVSAAFVLFAAIPALFYLWGLFRGVPEI